MSSILPDAVPVSPEVARFAEFRDALRFTWHDDRVTIQLVGPVADTMPAELRADLLEAAGDVTFLRFISRGAPVLAVELGAAA